MYFRVLGPLTVERDDATEVAIGASMIRRLPAALLCRANECVPPDDLAFALWGESAPMGARKTLQVYVRRLRGALLDTARISFHPAGYRINVTAHQFDAARFEQLVAEAGSADESRAALILEEALGLWRQLGQRDKACLAYRKPIALYASHGDRVFQAESLKHLGDTLSEAGEGHTARDAWRQALAIFADMGHPSTHELRSTLGDQ